MNWTRLVICGRCDASDWQVLDGQWTCVCGKVMAVSEIQQMQKSTAKPNPE